MKIIHTADLHLDSKMNAYLPDDKIKERKSELLTSFVNLCEKAKEERAEAILLSGDVFDTAAVSKTAGNVFVKGITDNPDIKFFYLKGNHDKHDIISRFPEKPDNLYTFDENWKSYSLARGITVTGIELMGRNSDDVADSLVLDASNYNIVMMHGTVIVGASKKKGEFINIKDMKNKNIDYLALGHIHSYKEDRLDIRGSYAYPGCLTGRGFDETGEKGYILLNIDETRKSYGRSFVPYPSRRLYAPEIDVSGCVTSGEIIDRVRAGLFSQNYPGEAMIEVILTGNVDVECEKDLDFISKNFESSFYYFKVKDMTKFTVDYGKFRLDASLRGEFIRNVMSKADISEEDKAEIIRMGMAALSGEEL